MTEKDIKKMMDTLHISREEAVEIIKDDEAIDKGEKLFELTAEQKKNAKSATITTSATKGYKFTKRERKPDFVKRELIDTIAHNIDRAWLEDWSLEVGQVRIVNPEKEVTFKVGEDLYSVTLTKHRKPKE